MEDQLRCGKCGSADLRVKRTFDRGVNITSYACRTCGAAAMLMQPKKDPTTFGLLVPNEPISQP